MRVEKEKEKLKNWIVLGDGTYGKMIHDGTIASVIITCCSSKESIVEMEVI